MRSSQPKSPSHSTHILLLASNQAGLKARKILLEEKGYQVTATSKTKDAVALLGQQPFSLLIADYKLDQLTGIEFLGSARQSYDTLSTVLLLSPMDEASAELDGCCADLIVTKNATEIPQLLRGVERLLTRRSPRKRPTSVRAPRVQKQKAQG